MPDRISSVVLGARQLLFAGRQKQHLISPKTTRSIAYLCRAMAADCGSRPEGTFTFAPADPELGSPTSGSRRDVFFLLARFLRPGMNGDGRVLNFLFTFRQLALTTQTGQGCACIPNAGSRY